MWAVGGGWREGFFGVDEIFHVVFGDVGEVASVAEGGGVTARSAHYVGVGDGAAG